MCSCVCVCVCVFERGGIIACLHELGQRQRGVLHVHDLVEAVLASPGHLLLHALVELAQDGVVGHLGVGEKNREGGKMRCE